MKNFKRIITLCLALALCLSCAPAVFAAEVADATIDMSRKGSLTVYKYDLTNAEKDGVWDSSYVSTGVMDQSGVVDVLGGKRAGDTDNKSDLGNGEASYGYAIKGVEFSYVKIAEIVQFSESTADGITHNHVEVLYGIDKVKGGDFLKALGLENGAERYANADQLDSTKYFYRSDVLIDALAAGLEANSTTVKNALEAYMAANPNRVHMALTDNNGKTIQRNLSVGLYLAVEDIVPEMVTSTTNPFFVSLPMTTVSGNVESASPEGGHFWNYDVVVYPKNETGIPTLEKTVREAMKDTGNNNGTSNINDGFEHNATGSAGDVMEYQILSTLPTITSNATSLTTYNFYDTISAGLTYNKSLKDVKIEFFTDADCTDKVATWVQDDGKFTVTYSSDDRHMTIDITAAGLAEINGGTANVNGKLYEGYSNYTARVTYTATINSNASFVFGEDGNCNEVVLTWKRTSDNYYDTLVDDAHVFTYGIDLTKKFSDGKGNFANVQFVIKNDTDNYFVKAALNAEEGIYYVTEHVANADEATLFTPVTPVAVPKSGEAQNKIIVKGLEDDTYTITEIRTDNGYVLLKDDIEIVISQTETTDLCNIYESDVLGLIQNDPRYAEIIKDTGDLKNMPQKHLEHHLLTASATVDGNKVTMLVDNGSENAEAPLTVVNTRGFDLPETGDNGTLMFTVFGILIMAGAAGVLYIATRKKKA